MLVKRGEFGFGGLSTTAQSTGLPLLEMTELQDYRIVGQDLIERYGMVRVGVLTGNASAADLDGVNEYFSNIVDPRVWTLGLHWTIEVAVNPDAITGDRGFLTIGSTTPCFMLDITGNAYRGRVWDSAGNATTVMSVSASVGVVQSMQFMRNAGTVTVRINDAHLSDTAISSTLSLRTPVGDLRVGRDDTTNYFDGKFCYFRAMSTSRSRHQDRLVRHPAPRAEYMLADYDFKQSAGGLVYDRSRYENHLIAQNTPSEIATLCHNAAPIRALSMTRNISTNRKELLACAGGKYYIAGAD